ncbi:MULTISPECIES: PmeII family type II restriction endonuclease [Cyanophyceae]|uniref:PmeII family type II restriction endonuclease n=1 Tax=Cyanophyceae TaxID=3028117 RepID=UPI00321F9759
MRVRTFSSALRLRAKFHNKTISIASEESFLEFKRYLLKNWFNIQANPNLLLTDEATALFGNQVEDIESIQVLASLLELDTNKLDLLVLFLDEILSIAERIPNLAKEAILTENPFLFRSLFLKFKEAEEFAVGGKLNSSLETTYGNLFEKLMGEFENCQRIYDGGVDVVVGGDAFDIKSGPNVMNKSMVDAFSAKQVLIQDKKMLPDISTYKIALGYGKKEQLNQFMGKIEFEILTGRESWKKITGIEHSPEIVFAIAGLVPRIFNVKSLVGSVLGESERYEKENTDVSEFEKLFRNNFTPINLTPEAQTEISTINSLLV